MIFHTETALQGRLRFSCEREAATLQKGVGWGWMALPSVNPTAFGQSRVGHQYTRVEADALIRRSLNISDISDANLTNIYLRYEHSDEVRGWLTLHYPTRAVNSPCSRRPRSFPACFSGEGVIVQRENTGDDCRSHCFEHFEHDGVSTLF